MDPLSFSTGGGGMSSSSGSDLTSKSAATFGGWGQSNYNFGSGSLSANTPNYWVIGGLAAAGLLALYMLRKKRG